MGEGHGTALAGGLVRAQAAAKAVGKDATNTFHRYRYASAEAIIGEARDALGAGGLALVPVNWEVIHPSREGAHAIVHSDYLLLHGDSGETMRCKIEWPIIPEKGRPEDKALAGAITTSLAYLLRGLLLLPREDEAASPDQRDDRAYTPRPSPPREESRPLPMAAAIGAAAVAAASTPITSDVAMRRDAFLADVAALVTARDASGFAALATRIRDAALPTDAHNAVVTAWKAGKAAVT